MTQASIPFALNATPAAELVYRCRPGLFSSETSWRLTHDALVRDGIPIRRIAYTDIRRIRLFGSPGLSCSGREVMPASGNCHIKVRGARSVALTSNHFLGFGRWENRSATYAPFVDRLTRHAVESNPDVIIVHVGMPLALWTLWAVIVAGTAAFVALAVGMVVSSASTIGAVLWTGDYRHLTFETFVSGGLALLIALFLGASVPILIRMLWREWPRRANRLGR